MLENDFCEHLAVKIIFYHSSIFFIFLSANYIYFFLLISFSRYLDLIESAVSNGECVLIESIGESLDPVLDPILGRNTIKKGR